MINRRGNALVIILAVLAIAFASATGYLLWQNQQKTSTEAPFTQTQPSKSSQATTPTGSKAAQEWPQRFVFHEEIVAKPTTNILTDRGVYKSQFIVYDLSNKSKTVFGEMTYSDDRADSYKLFQNKYILTISPLGNSITAINPSETSPVFPAGYDRSNVSPSGKKRIMTSFPRTTSETVTLSVIDDTTNHQETYPIQTKDLVPQFIGWSSDEKFVYYILIQTEAGNPGLPVYQMDTMTGEVKKIPRDPTIGKFSNLGLKFDQRDNGFIFAADNGLWIEKLGENKAKLVSLSSLDSLRKESYRILLPSSGNANRVAVSDGNKLIIKDLGDNSETLVANALPGGSIEPISWAGNFLVYIHDKQGSNGTEKQNGYFIVGEIYNTGSKNTVEFFNHKTSDMFTVGRFEFVGWLQ